MEIVAKSISSLEKCFVNENIALKRDKQSFGT